MLFVVMMSPDIVMGDLLLLLMLPAFNWAFGRCCSRTSPFSLPFVVVTVYSRLEKALMSECWKP
ncbi:hypothetical protein KCP71_21415 [Salmonella enterica subsp. enterica]|nr:hypothetical protein KCP71_21415 [Salmonella enterica subsp. enterica]